VGRPYEGSYYKGTNSRADHEGANSRADDQSANEGSYEGPDKTCPHFESTNARAHPRAHQQGTYQSTYQAAYLCYSTTDTLTTYS
jgi:hypothetical protein